MSPKEATPDSASPRLPLYNADVHHELLIFLVALAVLLAVARIMGEIARRFGLPAVAGEIIAGILIGKTVLGAVAPGAYEWLFPEGTARTLLTGYTTVAVMLLLVVAGIEVDLTVVRRSTRKALLISALGAVIPFALGYGLGFILPGSDIADPTRRGLHAAFLGIALSISALPVIAKTLLDLGLLKTDLGLIVLSAAVIDDLAGWIGFSVLSRQFATDTGSSRTIIISVTLTIVFVIGTLLVVRPVVDRLLARIQPPPDPNANGAAPATGGVLSMVMILSLLGAAATQALGMHAVFGGFVMGIAIGDSSRLREHTRTVLREFVTSIFTPVFFATIALRFDFAANFDARLVAVVLAIACVAKVAGCAAGARIGGIGWRESAAIGFGMNSRGAMEILLAVLALEAGIINTRLFVALVVMAVVTSLISGPAMSRLLRPPPSPVLALLRAGAIRLDMRAESPAEVILPLTHALAEKLGKAGDTTLIAAAVLAREELAGTGVGEGVAIPHAEIPGLAAPALAFARLADGVDFNAPDGVKVRIVFLLLTPPREFDRELQILAALVRLLMRDEVRRALLDAEDADAVLATLGKADRTTITPLTTPLPATSTPLPRQLPP